MTTIAAKQFFGELDELDSEAHCDPTPELTPFGRVLGTPAYRSPEQACGNLDVVDYRSDVYSFGAILCEILTGRPVTVDDESEIALTYFEATYRRLFACEFDVPLADLARRCLAENVEDRPANAGVLSQEIASYIASVENRSRDVELQRVRNAERLRRHYLLFFCMGLVTLTLGGVRSGFRDSQPIP